MSRAPFTEQMKMADVVLADERLLYVLPYLGIGLGFGEKSVGAVCAERGVSVALLLLVCNLYAQDDYTPSDEQLREVSVEGLVAYLERSHRDFLQVRMPRIIDRILALARGSALMQGDLLASFCEKYKQEVVAHFGYEEQVVFPTIRALLAGQKPDYRIDQYERNHSDIDAALEDLKNIILKYLPRDVPVEQSRPVLLELFGFEHDLRKHTRLEEDILIPLVERLDTPQKVRYQGVELTEREMETLSALARGMSNKEIADFLHISAHTVISHRKNIVRKTGIKTLQGLTLYALFNHLISSDELTPPHK